MQIRTLRFLEIIMIVRLSQVSNLCCCADLFLSDFYLKYKVHVLFYVSISLNFLAFYFIWKDKKKVILDECVFFYGDDETKAGLTAAISLVGW
jgi:hypothetical protein